MTLAQRQAQLVASLVAGGPVPDGFEPARLDVARKALLRKRAGEVRQVWPRLAASYGDDWVRVFGVWAAARPPAGAWRDGWDFARDHPPAGDAAIEFMVHDVGRRRGPWPAVRIGRGVVVIRVRGRVRVIR